MNEPLAKTNQEPQKPVIRRLFLAAAFAALVAAYAGRLIPALNEFSAVVSLAIGVLLLILLASSHSRLSGLNADLDKHLRENYENAKILIRRDLELTEANTRLQELDTAKSEFVSVAAHQLRTPLTGIRWLYHALLEEDAGELNNRQKRLVKEGLRTTLRTIELVNDLLNVARIEAGRAGFIFQRQSIIPIIKKVALQFEPAAAGKGVKLGVSLPEGSIPPLDLDAEKMSIVLENILDNAVKYTAPGGRVALALSAADNALRVEIADTGIGIPKEQQAQIFNKFFRADNALLFQTAGTGLGLYVVKSVIDRHNGTVAVKSAEGVGTTVTITLPVPKTGEQS